MSDPVLRVENLTKSFGHHTVVHSLSFAVNRGEIFGFLGPNGAGKSTTIRMILSLVHPDAGEVYIFDRPVTKYQNRTLKNVGALVESADFYQYLTGRQNLELLARLEKVPPVRIDEVLDVVGLTSRQHDKVKAYSHGMQQRLGIAQALLSSPDLLILDEPTTGLDPKGMKEVRHLIQSLPMKGITVLLSSHLLAEVEQICNTVGIINHGRLVIQGMIDDFTRSDRPMTTEIYASPMDTVVAMIAEQPGLELLEHNRTSALMKSTEDDIATLVRKLVTQDVSIYRILPRSPLEEIFLNLTADPAGRAQT